MTWSRNNNYSNQIVDGVGINSETDEAIGVAAGVAAAGVEGEEVARDKFNFTYG